MNNRLFLLLSVLISFSFHPKKNLLERGDEAYQYKAFHLAIKYYQAYLKKQDPCSPAVAKLADCYWQTYQSEKALTTYRRYMSCLPSDPEIHQKYALVLMEAGRYHLAKRQLKLYQKADPERATSLLNSCNWAIQQELQPVYPVDSLSQNSRASDFSACFRGDEIIFSSGRAYWQNNPHRFFDGENQLFYCTPKGEQEVKPFGSGEQNISSIHFSPGGQVAAFVVNDFVEGSKPLFNNLRHFNIYFSRIDSTGQKEESWSFSGNKEGYNTAFPSFSLSGDTLFFASDIPSGYGGYDLYYAVKDSAGQWAAPINLGAAINSPGNEITPFFHGEELFFSSDYFQGLGGFDIFKASTSLSGSLQISQLGKGVNSSGDDYGFNLNASGELAVFTSNRFGSVSGEDLYTAELEDLWEIKTQVIKEKHFSSPHDFRLSAHQRMAINTFADFLPSCPLPTMLQSSSLPDLVLYVPVLKTQSILVAVDRHEEPKAPVFDGRSPFQIRVTTLRRSVDFDESRIAHLGKIDQKSWGQYQIIYLTGYRSLEEAREAFKRLKALDFPKATLVKKLENGRLKSF